MKIKKMANAGTLESSDISILIAPGDNGEIEIELESDVYKQFGNQIKNVIKSTLNKYNITSAKIKAIDKGAVDYVIKARMETAIFRACESDEYVWEDEIDG